MATRVQSKPKTELPLQEAMEKCIHITEYLNDYLKENSMRPADMARYLQTSKARIHYWQKGMEPPAIIVVALILWAEEHDL